QTAPASGRSSPVMRLNSVDLPAPFGPMMPSASPAATSRLTPSTALSEPNDRVRFSSFRITPPPSPPSEHVSERSEPLSPMLVAPAGKGRSQSLRDLK